MFSTYRADSVISRLGRGEIDLADCPAEVAEVLALGERGRARVRRRVRRGAAATATVLDPAASSRAGRWSGPPRTLAALPDTDFCLSAGGDIVCRTLDPTGPPGGSASRTRTTRAGSSRSCRSHTGAVATSGTAHRGAHLVDARTGAAPAAVASVTVIGGELTWADIDATAAYALGADAGGWLRTRPAPHWWWHTDGTTTVVDASADR